MPQGIDVFIHPGTPLDTEILELLHSLFIAVRVTPLWLQRPVRFKRIAPYLKVSIDGAAQIGDGLIDVILEIRVAEPAFPAADDSGR